MAMNGSPNERTHSVSHYWKRGSPSSTFSESVVVSFDFLVPSAPHRRFYRMLRRRFGVFLSAEGPRTRRLTAAIPGMSTRRTALTGVVADSV
jgi:hypothetical protein